MSKWVLQLITIGLTMVFCGLTPGQSIQWDEPTGQAVLVSGRLELVVQTKDGINAHRLRDTQTGRVYADGDYLWPGGTFPQLWSKPVIKTLPEGGKAIILNGKLADLLISQQFTIPQGKPGVILEKITITNPGTSLLDTSRFACGFARRLTDDAEALRSQFCYIPFRRYHSLVRDFTPADMIPAAAGTVWGSEGWAWSQGQNTLLITKYNNDDMEWSLLEVVKPENEKAALRFGGCGLWGRGDPERAASLKPGQAFTFGITRFEVLDGDWKDAFYAHRAFMDGQGHALPNDYNPPVHWNELYDNEYYFKVTAGAFQQPSFVKETQKKYYTLDHMKAEAAKASELGCECLYLDPGWDTGPSHFVWDEARLGTQRDFIKMLRQEYGIQHLGLWCALAHTPPGYTDPKPYSVDVARLDENGNVITFLWQAGSPDQHEAQPVICSYSPAFHDVKLKQMLKLCEDGAKFLMFDGSQYTGPCYDSSHGHSIPLTRHEHVMGYYGILAEVMRQYPETLIELHDPVLGPSSERYTPIYFCHARPATFELWGYEYMWGPMGNLLSGDSTMLYYTNLAYNIPIYLHINLKDDNANALVFWWNASLCRHLGVGGKHPDENVWQAHKDAMQTYLRLKPFFTQGEFYGLDEMIHVHTLKEKNAAVINCFNLAETPETKTFTFNLSQMGLSANAKYEIKGASSFKQDGDQMEVKVELAGRDAAVLEVKSGK
ncbi:MAG: hypothetical protein BWY71_00218 [Planctomycetes bacterium ADurb.Bin412]|nr:MAG: hypothetical protein BWY71_00218 [Planctomycetes bacterium ADurb.Bin412]